MNYQSLSPQMFEAITPAKLIDHSVIATETRTQVLKDAARLTVDLMEALLQAKNQKTQVAFINATKIFVVTLCAKIEAYRKMLKEMDMEEAVKQDCFQFYQALEADLLSLMAFLEKDCRVITDGAQPANSTKPIQTNLNVGQLALFLRLQVEAGIIQTENRQEVIEQTRTYYKTVRAKSLSQESMSNKFYTPDPAAVSILRTYLVNMLNELKRL
jgi:hypothetical protein